MLIKIQIHEDCISVKNPLNFNYVYSNAKVNSLKRALHLPVFNKHYGRLIEHLWIGMHNYHFNYINSESALIQGYVATICNHVGQLQSRVTEGDVCLEVLSESLWTGLVMWTQIAHWFTKQEGGWNSLIKHYMIIYKCL